MFKTQITSLFGGCEVYGKTFVLVKCILQYKKGYIHFKWLSIYVKLIIMVTRDIYSTLVEIQNVWFSLGVSSQQHLCEADIY